MRISDWSSDVCSSDLPAIRAVGRRQPVIIRVVDPIAGAEQQRIHPEADREAAIAVLPAVRRIIARQAIGRAVAGAIIAPVVAAIVAPAAIELGPIVRSEEHTSELQSLMRNPYAVFCLKTKQLCITHHNNT